MAFLDAEGLREIIERRMTHAKLRVPMPKLQEEVFPFLILERTGGEEV